MSARAGTSDDIAIVPVDRLELRLTDRPWRFALERRDEIEQFFAEQQKVKAGMWNGRILLMHQYAIEGGVFHGSFLQTDFAAFHAWTESNFPDREVVNCFAAGALRTVYGAFFLGVMGRKTANAGNIYFPCGTPDPEDLDGTRINFDRGVRREIAEETGLGDGDFAAAPGWSAVLAGPRIALIKLLQAHEPAASLGERIRKHFGREAEPELADIRLVRSAADFEAKMPEFVTAYLQHAWTTRQ
jgi:8-oxo-dGTP pyrophosphatase MutT (NUDIX family)